MALETLIHIGYHKTASTWLQTHILDNPETLLKRFFSKKDIRDFIVLPHSLDFNSKAVRTHHLKLMKQAIETENLSEDTISVISSERLSGHPHSGGYDSKEIADRLKACFPDGKVLIVIREQKSAISSCYLQYVKYGGTCSIKDYIKPPKRGLPVIPLFKFEHFDYVKLIQYYRTLFGEDKVLVIPYELFKDDPQKFYTHIVEFSGAKRLKEIPFGNVTNKRLSYLMSKFARQANKLFVKTTLNPSAPSSEYFSNNTIGFFMVLDRLVPKFIKKICDKSLDKYIESQVGERFLEGNKELQKIVNFDLSKYGYDL